MPLTLEQFAKARQILKPILNPTPLVFSRHFSHLTGGQVYLKPENLQLTGAYKIRGAYYKVATLPAEQRRRGLITASAGNHAQGVALAAQMNRLKAVIVMPTATPLVKVNNTRDYGATVILFGENYDEAYEHAQHLAQEKGYTFIHPFNDLDVATGQCTLAYEILEELPDADVIILPIGGGGLAAGVATLAKLLRPQIEIVGVEPKGAAAMCLSCEQGVVCTLDRVDTIADGVAVKTPGPLVFPYVKQNVDRLLAIDETELIDAFLDVMEKHKLVVENAGLLSVAALSHLPLKGRKAVALLSGGKRQSDRRRPQSVTK